MSLILERNLTKEECKSICKTLSLVPSKSFEQGFMNEEQTYECRFSTTNKKQSILINSMIRSFSQDKWQLLKAAIESFGIKVESRTHWNWDSEDEICVLPTHPKFVKYMNIIDFRLKE